MYIMNVYLTLLPTIIIVYTGLYGTPQLSAGLSVTWSLGLDGGYIIHMFYFQGCGFEVSHITSSIIYTDY